MRRSLDPLELNKILGTYADLFVQCDDQEAQRLFFLFSLFFAKCDRLLSTADVQHAKGDLRGIPFDPYETPPQRREQILLRLKSLKRYRISNPKEIIRIMTFGLFTTDAIKPSDRRYLVAFIENPGKPFARVASGLGITPASVFAAYRRLRAKIQLRFADYVNYPFFKLRHHLLFFKPEEGFSVSALEREFTLTFNRDVFTDWMWASFLVPDQDRTQREFKEGLKAIGDRAFAEHRLYEVRSNGRSYNLSLFDGEKWIFTEEALAVGALRFAEQTDDATPSGQFVRELNYASAPARFDDVDFLIACLKFGNARARNAEIRNVLRGYGYDLSWVTVSRRVSALTKLNAIMTIPNFSGLGLTMASAYAVECDDAVTETLYRAFSQFPECSICRTDKGVVFMVRAPPDTMPAIAYMVQSALRDRAERLIVANRLENVGSHIPIDLHSHWNTDKQYWAFERGFFDLSKPQQQK
jgi:DNA-binding Lrp family transcriptional regulator